MRAAWFRAASVLLVLGLVLTGCTDAESPDEKQNAQRTPDQAYSQRELNTFARRLDRVAGDEVKVIAVGRRSLRVGIHPDTAQLRRWVLRQVPADAVRIFHRKPNASKWEELDRA